MTDWKKLRNECYVYQCKHKPTTFIKVWANYRFEPFYQAFCETHAYYAKDSMCHNVKRLPVVETISAIVEGIIEGFVSKYKSEWKEFELNKEFWREVLVGRTIKDVVFDDMGIKHLLLDNNEEVFVVKNENGKAVFCIRD